MWLRLKGNDGRYAVTYTAGIEWSDGDLPTSEATQFCHTRVEKIDKGLNKMAAVVSLQLLVSLSFLLLLHLLLMKVALRKCLHG